MSDVPPELRERAERATELEAQNAQMAEHNALRDLEVAGMRAGIDLTSRQGKAWAATYDGDWNDGEAMKADFSSMFPTPETPTPTQQVEETKPEDFTTGITGERQRLTGDPVTPADPNAQGDPYADGFEAMMEARKNGRPEENARAEVLNRVIDAAANGDDRVLWTPEHRAAWMEETGAAHHQ